MCKLKKVLNLKAITVFVLLVCMVLVSGCGSQPNNTSSQTTQANTQSNNSTSAAATQPPQTQGSKEAVPGDLKVIITPPAGWNEVPGSAALAQYMKGASSFIVTGDYIPTDASTPDAFVDLVKAGYSSAFDGVEFTSSGDVTVAGTQAKVLEFTCKISGMGLKYRVYYVFKGGKAYTFTCASLLEGFDSIKGDFDAFMSSVKFE